MRNKILAILLIGTLAVSAVACGKKESVLDEKQEATASEEVTKSEQTEEKNVIVPEKKEEQVIEEEPALPVEEKEFLDIKVRDCTYTKEDIDRSRFDVATVKYSQILLSEEDAAKYPLLADAMDKINRGDEQSFANSLTQMYESYLEYVDDDYYEPYEESTQKAVLRSDKKVLSWMEQYYSYQGGAHGFYAVGGEAYDVQTGKKLTLVDVVADEEGFKTLLKEKLYAKYEGVYWLYEPEEYINEIELGGGQMELKWSMDYAGVTIYFAPYELASYADGMFTVRIAFAEKPEMFHEEYLETPDSYILPLCRWSSMYVDVDLDNEEEELSLLETQENEWGETEWNVRIDGENCTDSIRAYTNDSYIIHKKDKNYVYFFGRVENDYEVLSVIDLGEKKDISGEWEDSNYGLFSDYEYDEEHYANIRYVLNDVENILLDSHMDLLSTYGAYRTYRVGDNGMPEAKDDMYHANTYYLISPKQDIHCEQVDEKGVIIEKNAVIPANTKLRIIGNDGRSVVYLQDGGYNVTDSGEDWVYWYTEDPLDLNRGKIYRVEIIRDEESYEQRVDGVYIFDLFEGMMFAG